MCVRMSVNICTYIHMRICTSALQVDNLMHADLHPGNILLRTPALYGSLSLALIDAGMVARLTQAEADGIYRDR